MPSKSCQKATDQKNCDFWDELCGHVSANLLGITDDSPQSITIFDDWFFDQYQWLFKYIPFKSMEGKKVLEVGLGYGSVAQKIMESGAQFSALDISRGPVEMAKHRSDHVGVNIDARQGSILQAPWETNSFDYIVSIGCLHHTGNLSQAIDEVHRCLKPGGSAVLMVYNALSYRQWASDFGKAWRRFKNPTLNWTNHDEVSRSQYDHNAEGEVAPETTFVAKNELRQYLQRDFKDIRIGLENINTEWIFRYIPRQISSYILGWLIGLDLYCVCTKKIDLEK